MIRSAVLIQSTRETDDRQTELAWHIRAVACCRARKNAFFQCGPLIQLRLRPCVLHCQTAE